ncbi:MAG: MOSC domain-containing protein [Marmoricola sp.]
MSEGRVHLLRRYPIKAMGGEGLTSVELDARGLVGDRWYAVEDEDGHFASGKRTRRFRRRDEVFDYAARSEGGGVIVSGPEGEWRVDDPELSSTLSGRMGVPVRVLPEAEVPHQDAGSVSLVGTATLDWCADRWGIDADPRRLRVNIVLETSEPFIEETWIGRRIAVGEVELDVVARIERCRTIDVAQDGATGRGRWLKPLAAEREMCAAIYANVAKPGTIAVGDRVSYY